MSVPDLKKLTVRSAAAAIEKGETSSVELCKALLERAKSLEPKIKAFVTIDEGQILRDAELSDKRRAQKSPLGRFDGVPLAIKDCISVDGHRCSCGSKILESHRAVYDATAVARLRKQGFVMFGRANMDEFAMGSSCENSAFAKTANPWDTARVPGGSSGGSAAAVASGEVPAALGSDTGGSIRQPASFCGLVGLKPTYGRVSRYGLVAYASSLDQIGPITRDVPDAAAILDIIGGHDPMDTTSLPSPCGGFADVVAAAEKGSLKGLKIGLPKEYFEVDALDAGVKKVINEAVELTKSLGAELVEISLPHTKYAIAAYYIIATAEASANLARYDGVRYGFRSPKAADLRSMYFETRGDGFGEEVRRRIILGTFVLSSGYYDAYYLRAQKVRTLIRSDFTEAFKKCSLILTPVCPAPAFKFGEKSDPLQMYLADIFTIALNLSGNCGLSVPAGLDPATGMPVGVQFIAPALAEDRLLSAARVFELNRPCGVLTPAV
jgi:aspartyl-tRNA(Asn)/glutamyl-tRNA(Gln) amidotransferase subunit A